MQSSTLESFDPVRTINSGQVFLWQRRLDSWYGIYGRHVVKISETEGIRKFTSIPELDSCENRIFRLDDDVKTIYSELKRDPLVRRLLSTYPGLRLMRQEPEQCLFSFVCASNTNISMIRRMLFNLTRRFGDRVMLDGLEFFSFPSADEISKAQTNDLLQCGLGYRAKAIKAVADSIVNGTLDLGMLTKKGYHDAKRQLTQIYGVGNKIADCVLLFSLDKLEAFPVDVWIARALSKNYPWLFDSKVRDKLTSRQYGVITDRIRQYFGRYAGYAQQYLYYHMRQQAGASW
ncbi:MAG: DNA-3-methyladenine glycosylase family protein [Nitrososphaera sp.]